MVSPLPQGFSALVDHQRGMATVSQLRGLGMTRAQIRWRLQDRWRQVLPGVVATFTGRPDPTQDLIAAMLMAGPQSVITSLTAAAWRGLDVPPTRRILIDVPFTAYAARHGRVEVRRTRVPHTSVTTRGALRIAAPPRTVADAVRDCPSQREATALLLHAVQRRVVGIEQLHGEHDLHHRPGNAFLKRALDAAAMHSWSTPEHELFAALSAHPKLPEIWANPMLSKITGEVLPTPDLWIDAVALAMQIHSRTYHESAEDWDRTVSQDGRLSETGVTVLPFTPAQIATRLPWVVSRVERTYLNLLGRPRPAVVARHRGDAIGVDELRAAG